MLIRCAIIGSFVLGYLVPNVGYRSPSSDEVVLSKKGTLRTRGKTG